MVVGTNLVWPHNRKYTINVSQQSSMSQREKRIPKNDSNKGSRHDFKRKTIEKAKAKKAAVKNTVKKQKKIVKMQKKINGRKPSAQQVTKLRNMKTTNSYFD